MSRLAKSPGFSLRLHDAVREYATVWSACLALSICVFAIQAPAVANEDAETLRVLRDLQLDVLTPEERQQAESMLSRDIERRRLLAIERENQAWARVQSRQDWEAFRDQRVEALRNSLGQFGNRPTNSQGKPFRPPPAQMTGAIQGEGYRIENLVFESRPGLFGSANLYLPSPAKESMPAILLSHSHHAAKTQAELQHMGINWARNGWVVLVTDHLGHGERRQHPFATDTDYPKPFRVSRQDYYFRYNTGLQLQLVGESLMGWMAWDLMRGVDLLLARDNVDPARVILIGAVAGGGDPAGVAAALDERIAMVAPFNFGGPQPDYAIPDDAENQFYYFGVAYWESTRCLRLGGRDGFAHWTIVGSVAPRRLAYSFEFGWERERDPVWPRLEKVFGFYGARDHLAVAQGRGQLKGRPPENTHCTNVGQFHRAELYPHLERWFEMTPPKDEISKRHSTAELTAFTQRFLDSQKPTPLHQLASRLGAERAATARRDLQKLDNTARLNELRNHWSQVLGNREPALEPKLIRTTTRKAGGIAIEQMLLDVGHGIMVPVCLLRDAALEHKRAPLVVAISEAGKQEFLANRTADVSQLLEGGAIVCLPDLRGTGESRASGNDGPRSTGATLSCREQVLGQTVLGSRLRDLRSILQYVRRTEPGPIALWGESLAETNPPTRPVAVPHGVDNPNVQAQPSAGLLALLGGLFEDDVVAVCAGGTFASYDALLKSPFLYIPHDAVIPGAMTIGDLAGLAASCAPRPLRMDNFIDGTNRPVPAEIVLASLEPTRQSYREQLAEGQLTLAAQRRENVAQWILSKLSVGKTVD